MKNFLSKIKTWFTTAKKSDLKRKRKSLRERSTSIVHYKKALELRFKERVDRDLKKGEIQKAITRYEGSFKHNSVNQMRHNEVALLYLQVADKIRAGKHLFFKKNPSAIEEECIVLFEKSCGNCATNILKKLIHKENYRIKELDLYAQLKLKKLIDQAVNESGTLPRFLIGIKGYLDKINDVSV